MEVLINNHILPHAAELRCGDVTANLLRALVGSPASATTATRLAAVIGGLVRAGLDGGFLADTSLSSVDWRDGIVAVGRSGGAVHGCSAVFIEPDQIPGHGEVAALAAALAARHSWQLELAVHLAACSGLRFGEMAALRANRVDAEARAIQVVEQASEFRGRIRQSAPKGGKARTTVYPAVTPRGYPLGAMIDRRLRELDDVGSGKGGTASLVFPAPRGGLLRASNFTRQVLGPARAAAGWADRGNAWTWHSLRHVFCTTALNDWHLPLTDVSMLAGHATTAITAGLYTNPVSGVLSRALRATERSL
ncbi:tyrosine-type recombinase/integrase [Catenulispora pinisilvae]|uniref:tyrosine-type recombinase/integrase n=1 Tax=Catenulispora pinisilvae TaxID=2705253 RepID=UPI001891A6CD|nr:site-specific integrase [Catenulispora pinisilvae]